MEHFFTTVIGAQENRVIRRTKAQTTPDADLADVARANLATSALVL
jgi:hypothetical protein